MTNKMLARINRTKLPSDLLGRVMEEIANSPAGDRDFEGSTFTIIRIVADMGLPEKRRQDLVLATSVRLMALARLLNAQKLHGFTLPGSEGSEWVHADAVKCATDQPVVLVDDDFYFDRAQFERRLLTITSAAGNA